MVDPLERLQETERENQAVTTRDKRAIVAGLGVIALLLIFGLPLPGLAIGAAITRYVGRKE